MGLGSSSSSIPQDKHIVIVGAGYGGIKLATDLLKQNANFSIIDMKDAFHHNVASVRAVVEPGFAKKMVVHYEPTFGTHFRRGKVTKINTEAKVINLEDGTEISYDVLVIATGSFGPMKESNSSAKEIIEKYSKIAEEVKKSQNVVIVGGGPVGVEVASEVATIYPEKRVTLVHNLSKLISEDAPSNFVNKVMSISEHLHINLVIGEGVENLADLPDGVHGSYQVKTDKGKTIEADIIIKCIGLKVNSAAYASSLSDHMEANGALKVNEFGQVEGFDDVFALGDCCNSKEMKLAMVAKLQADHVKRNIANLFHKRALEPWHSGNVKYYMGLSMGSRRGVLATAGGWILPEFLIVSFKCKDMMTGMVFKDMNQVVPK